MNSLVHPSPDAIKVVIDETVPRNELRVHPSMFDRLYKAFFDADLARDREVDLAKETKRSTAAQ